MSNGQLGQPLPAVAPPWARYMRDTRAVTANATDEDALLLVADGCCQITTCSTKIEVWTLHDVNDCECI